MTQQWSHSRAKQALSPHPVLWPRLADSFLLPAPNLTLKVIACPVSFPLFFLDFKSHLPTSVDIVCASSVNISIQKACFENTIRQFTQHPEAQVCEKQRLAYMPSLARAAMPSDTFFTRGAITKAERAPVRTVPLRSSFGGARNQSPHCVAGKPLPALGNQSWQRF